MLYVCCMYIYICIYIIIYILYELAVHTYTYMSSLYMCTRVFYELRLHPHYTVSCLASYWACLVQKLPWWLHFLTFRFPQLNKASFWSMQHFVTTGKLWLHDIYLSLPRQQPHCCKIMEGVYEDSWLHNIFYWLDQLLRGSAWLSMTTFQYTAIVSLESAHTVGYDISSTWHHIHVL